MPPNRKKHPAKHKVLILNLTKLFTQKVSVLAGNDLLSHPYQAVSSALLDFTSAFGMIPGLSPTLLSPAKPSFCFYMRHTITVPKHNFYTFTTTSTFRRSYRALVPLGYRHYCPSTYGLSHSSSPSALRLSTCDLILRLASHLDAFSGSPYAT